PDLSNHYKLIMKEYSDIVTHIKTKFAIDWRKKFYDSLSLDVVDDYLMLNNIIPHNKNEVEKAFEEHWKILNELDYYGNKVEGKLFPDGSNRLPEESEKVLERLKMIPPGENYLFVKETKWKVEGRGMSLIYRRLHPLKPAYTVVAYGGGGTWGYHYKRHRGRLTNRERARLQTFPDWFLFKGNTSEMRAQIGEAVPPLLGKKIAEIVDTILGFGR
ncbi:MAG: DNA cytosine methyltransferase, partial [Nitrososphaerota archaeon]